MFLEKSNDKRGIEKSKKLKYYSYLIHGKKKKKWSRKGENRFSMNMNRKHMNVGPGDGVVRT